MGPENVPGGHTERTRGMEENEMEMEEMTAETEGRGVVEENGEDANELEAGKGGSGEAAWGRGGRGWRR